jgi:hypothetical protein
MKLALPSYRSALSAGLLASLAAWSGCASAPPAPTPKTTISARIPVVAPLPETKEAQEKGGVEIAVVPAAYAPVTKQKYSVAQKAPGFGRMLGASLATGGNSQNLIYVEESYTPFLAVEPGRLQFTVRVNNKLSRVFRGQGAVVQFNLAGKLVPFGDTDYAEMINGIVPPRNENTFTIKGPRLDALPEKGTIGIFLYDVVTQTDVAGNVIEKQNYEWYFDYSLKTVEAQAEVKAGETYMDAAAFQMALLKARKRAVDDPDTLESFTTR